MSHQTDLTLTGGQLFNYTPPTPVTGAGRTLLPSEILTGMVDRAMGGSKTDVLPTAADLIAAMSRGGYAPPVGVSFDCWFRNQAAATDVLTIALGSGMSTIAVSTLTIPAASARLVRFVVTAGGTVAVYSLTTGLT